MRPIDQVRQFLAANMAGPSKHFMERRKDAAAFAAAFQTPADTQIEAGELGGVAVEWIRPVHASRDGTIFHLHGGGYVLGDPAASRVLTTELARRCQMPVVSVDYAIAPENPFPGAVTDAVAAFRGLLEGGHCPSSVAIGGESAGGGLAVATLVAAREAGLALPSCLFAISPWVDLTCSSRSYDLKESVDPMLTRRSLMEMAEAYLGQTRATAPLASPAMADLRNLPPMLIQVGSEEVLLDDAKQLHRQATEAGVLAELEVWDDMIHVWHLFHGMLPEGRRALARVAEFVTAHIKERTSVPPNAESHS